jgi:hypothetical protein
MSGDGTVEWAGDRPVRLLDRLFGDTGGGGPRLSAPAVGAAMVGAALFVVAELLPWMTLDLTANYTAPGAPAETRHLQLDMVGAGIATAYYVGLFLLLAVVGLVQVSRPHARRVLTAAGIGLATGMLVLLVGAVRRAGEGGEATFVSLPESASPGPGPYLAIAAVLLMVAALVVSGWHPSVPHRRPVAENPVDDVDDDDDDEPGPIDLTVTPA